jgi:hypothetical protein
MRKFGRTDTTQKAIVEAFRKFGASVTSTADIGNGFPDLVVGWRKRTILVECKTGNGGLTPDQVAFLATWGGGPIAIARSVEDVEIILKGKRR